MKLFCNILLGLLALLSILLLVFQGFLIPALATWLCVLLRLVGAICLQLLLLRTAQKKWIQALPAIAAGVMAVWGFFLWLTSPSWRGVTFTVFFGDYAMPLAGCALVWLLHVFKPQLRRTRKYLKRRIKKHIGK